MPSVSFMILINGATSPLFHAEWGLRQGCPLSPLLFLLVAKGLRRFLIKAKAYGDFRGINISPGLAITHLLFVDDILIFCNGSRRGIQLLSEGMDLFRRATGMLINEEKSTVNWENLYGEDMRTLELFFRFQCRDLDSGLKYLGFSLKPNDYRRRDWMWLLAKIERKLYTWSHRWLSRAGRLVMVKEVPEAMPVYWMALTWIPRGILDKIRRMCFSFLWSGSKEKKTMPWVRWERIAIPKALGGWGLKNIFHFSKALAAKSGWHLISLRNLWTEVVWHKYIAHELLLDWIQNSERRVRGISGIWKAILDAIGIICSGLVWQVGSGHAFRLGLDPWPGSRQSHILSNELIEDLHQKGYHFLSCVRDEDGTTIYGQGWKSGHQIGLLEAHDREWSIFVVVLRGAHIRLSEAEEVLVWYLSPDGNYSPKVSYASICVDHYNRAVKWWWKRLWKIQCPTKNKIPFWSILENKVPTWDVLQKKSFEGPGWCCLSKGDVESIQHLFLGCPFSQQVWSEVLSLLQL